MADNNTKVRPANGISPQVLRLQRPRRRLRDRHTLEHNLPLVEVTINEMRVSGGELQTRTHSFWVPKDGTTGSWTKLYDIGEC